MVRAFVLLMLVLLAGCKTWNTTDGTLFSAGHSFSVVPPDGWHYVAEADDAVALTRDGPMLQWIQVNMGEGRQRFISARIENMASVYPSELAQYYLTDFKLIHADKEVVLVSLAPATVGGHKGFKMLLSVIDERGLRLKFEVYGGVAGSDFFELSYAAPELHYFDRDHDAFRKVVETFSISDGASS